MADPRTAGMGTTVTVAFVDQPASSVVFGHVGDSRAYRLRRRRARAGHDRPLARRRARRERRPDPRGGRTTPAAIGDHASGRDGAERSRPTSSRSRRGGRPVPPLLRRPHGHALGGRDRGRPRRGRARPGGGRPGARGRGQRARRRGQHHRRALRARRGSAGGGRREQRRTEGEVPSAETGEPSDDVRTHGAGPGGQLTALVVLALVLVVGLLALYWGIKR